MWGMDGVRGATAALLLPGLSLAVEGALQLSCRRWQGAMEACEALLAGEETSGFGGLWRQVFCGSRFCEVLVSHRGV